MKFVFPQNYNFKSKLFGIFDYGMIFLNLFWDLFVFALVYFIPSWNVKLFLFFILCFPLLLFSFSGFNGESLIYVIKYVFGFFVKQKFYIFKKNN